MAYQADNIRVKVGYPLSPNTTNAASIAKYYSLVKIENDMFFENMLNAAYVFCPAIPPHGSPDYYSLLV